VTMWSTDTPWFDVALVGVLLAVGNALLGRFSEYQPRWQRLLKIALGVLLFVGVSVAAGRAWMYAAIGATLGAVAVIHGWWLPRRGVNGWTAEPRERYYALLGRDAQGRRVAPGRSKTEAHP
jgi:hypothetical protein